ncbi:MAG: EAL domain-containing protein, partial [Bullifex sp.]
SEKERSDRAAMEAEVRELKSDMVQKWGIYEITDKTVSVDQMCDRALLAADSIKGQYSTYSAVYNDALREKLVREKEITDAMENALEEDQFTVYLQPKYSLITNTMAGAEALVRWIHPEWGFMSPGEFIPLFEKNGFITKLDLWVCEKVCSLMRKWQDAGLDPVPVSVNISRRDIFQADIVSKLTEITSVWGIEPELLHIEITESAYSDQPQAIVSAVEKLKDRGFIIEMDDFGSGYSSLNMLNELRIDILKLDMKFIQNEMKKSAGRSILRFVMNLAHWMGLSVVAEGVETAEQVKRLRLISCDYVQGYFFSRPLPSDEFEALLSSQGGSCEMNVPLLQDNGQEDEKCIIAVADEDESYRNRVIGTFAGEYDVRAFDTPEGLTSMLSGRDSAVRAIILSRTLPGGGFDRVMKFIRRDPAFWKIPVLTTLQGGIAHEELPDLMDSDDFLCKYHPMSDLKHRVGHLIKNAQTEERRILLEDEASRDFLTGLLNRRGLQIAIDQVRRDELPVSLLLFDLDDLKKVNDTYGHEKGDMMLRTFADIVRKNTRSYDITCRYGGDEFLVIMKRTRDQECVERKAEDICKAFSEAVAGNGIQASSSCGIATGADDETPTARMISRADRALYNAKRENKGGFSVFQ